MRERAPFSSVTDASAGKQGSSPSSSEGEGEGEGEGEDSVKTLAGEGAGEGEDPVSMAVLAHGVQSEMGLAAPPAMVASIHEDDRALPTRTY